MQAELPGFEVSLGFLSPANRFVPLSSASIVWSLPRSARSWACDLPAEPLLSSRVLLML